jgi:hypothetical protein
MEKQNWTKEDVEYQVLNVYNTQDIGNYSELDTESIMMSVGSFASLFLRPTNTPFSKVLHTCQCE